jgi:type II secretory pathway pseudopilin PulG
VRNPVDQQFARRRSGEGFALVASLLLLLLLGSLCVGLLTLASVELRKASRDEAAARARGNARLALVEAIGQLQRTLGPDQRISASAEILGGDVTQPQWTGVWRSTLDSGEPFLTRDALDGGLRDSRWSAPAKSADRVMEWLVSGSADPREVISEDAVCLFTVDEMPAVSVPRVPLAEGHLAWWTGDLGVRANLRTPDPRHELAADPASPGDGGLFRVMASQTAEMELMEGGVDLENSAGRLVSAGSLALVGTQPGWARDHVFDFTTDSSGVLADVAGGGMKRDLTAYFEKSPVAAFASLSGLADDDTMVAVGESDISS